MLRSFQRIRHLNRYGEIIQTFARYGFSEALSRLGLAPRVPWRRKIVVEAESPHLSAPIRFRMALEELGPTFVKMGQMLSTRPDLLPPDFIRELEKLQDDAAPVAWSEIRRVVEEELGGTIGEFFKSVDENPLASASIAQVHAAELFTGEQVVLKVQRPSVETTIDVDLEILYDLAALAQAVTQVGKTYDLPSIVDDFSYTIRAELDYRREGQNAELFSANFRKNDHIVIPKIYWEFATHRLLVMERIYGIKIDNIPKLDEKGYDRTVLADRAAQIVIKEILEDGFFHADPHPGNLFVLDGGLIGVLDFGMVGWLDDSTRILLAQLYIVTVRQDLDGIVDLLVKLEIADLNVNRRELRHDVNRLLRQYYGRPLGDIRVSEFLEDFSEIVFHYKLRIPGDIWLLIKTLATLEGVALRLDPEFDIFSTSQKYIDRLARRLYSFQRFRHNISSAASTYSDFLTVGPDVSLRILKRLERGDLTVKLEPTGLEPFYYQMDRISNRLSLSILIAALVLGLAFLIPRLEGAPGWIAIVAGVSFFVVTFLGLWLIISILRGTR